MKSIPKILICCSLLLAVMQNSIAANTTAGSAPPPNTPAYKPVKKPTLAEIQKKLEDKGIKTKKRKVLAKQKDLEHKIKEGKKPKSSRA